MRYGLERLLYRLEATGHSNAFVLKGAMLFVLWHDVPNRSTRDIDFLGLGALNHERLRNIFTDTCNVSVIDDGLQYDADSIRTDDIRDDQEYHGIRVRLLAFLGNARLPIQIDVGLGDNPLPPPELIQYPAILDFPAPRVRAYHPATVIAEKLNAVVILGIVNSRMKDFYDMYVMLKNMAIDDVLLETAIRSTFQRRKVPIPSKPPSAFTSEFLENSGKEKQWQTFLKRSALQERELSLDYILAEIRERLWPILCRLQKNGT